MPNASRREGCTRTSEAASRAALPASGKIGMSRMRSGHGASAMTCRNQSVEGVKFFGPRYHFHAGKEHRTDVEKKVFAELKGASPTI